MFVLARDSPQSAPAQQSSSDDPGVCGARECEGGQAGPQGGQDDPQQPPAAGGQGCPPGPSGDQPSHAAATSTLHEGQIIMEMIMIMIMIMI